MVRPELHLADNDPFAYYFLPLTYSTLTCSNGAKGCANYRTQASQMEPANSIAFNENLSMTKARAGARAGGG